jgi:hypothetical protein
MLDSGFLIVICDRLLDEVAGARCTREDGHDGPCQEMRRPAMQVSDEAREEFMTALRASGDRIVNADALDAAYARGLRDAAGVALSYREVDRFIVNETANRIAAAILKLEKTVV